MKTVTIIYFWLFPILLLAPKFNKAQDINNAQDTSVIARFTEKMNSLQNTLQYEKDAAKKKVLTQQIIDDLKLFDKDPSKKHLVDRGNWMLSIASILSQDYTMFKTYFDPLPMAFKDQLISSSTTEFAAWPQGSSFALDYMESRKKEKQADLEGLAKNSKIEKTAFARVNEDYHYWLLSLSQLYILTGKANEAKKQLSALQSHFGIQSTNLNKITAVINEQQYGADSTISLLEKYISLARFDDKMLAQLKRLYIQKHASDTGFNDYLSHIKSTYIDKIQKELPHMEVKEEAPLFTLKNIKGEEISLAALKGKVVILDFWATWCGPCRASFPTMQELVNDYKKKGDDVAFLFISTGERGNRPDTVVMNYLKTTNYTFEVLLDLVTDNVANNYKINGLPTKLIIDRDGFIRFKPGHRDDYYYMKKEMETMIDYLLREKS